MAEIMVTSGILNFCLKFKVSKKWSQHCFSKYNAQHNMQNAVQIQFRWRAFSFIVPWVGSWIIFDLYSWNRCWSFHFSISTNPWESLTIGDAPPSGLHCTQPEFILFIYWTGKQQTNNSELLSTVLSSFYQGKTNLILHTFSTKG